MTKILCLGNCSYDITLPLEEYPKENIKYRVSKKVECGGGPASNAAYLLGKWGMDTTFAGIIGDDLYGQKIKKEFESVNVNVNYLEMNKNMETPVSFILVNEMNASRTIFTYRNQEIKMKKKKWNLKPDYILVDGEESEMAELTLRRNKDAIKIIDAGKSKPHIIKLAKLCDYIVASKNFAEDYTGIKIDLKKYSTIHEVFRILEENFSGKIVITVESDGCLYKDGGKVKLMPGYHTKAVDSTGAGDIFHGAFVYALVKGYSYENIMRFANITGGLSVRKIGGRYSVPPLEEVLEIYEKSL